MEFPRKEYPPLYPKQSLEFQITDWYIPEADKTREKDEDEFYTIIVYGTMENGATVCAKVVNYIPYFYVKPPESWEKLNDADFRSRVEEHKQIMLKCTYEASFKNNTYSRKIIPKKIEKHLENVSVVEKKDFWGFTNNKTFRYIKVSVKSLQLYNSLKYYFMHLEKTEKFKLYESNIDPFLKYIHIQDIKPCSWVKIEKYEVSEDISRCNYNITVKHKYVKPVEINKIAPLLITSFDIECTSSHGDFPVAIKDYRKVAQDLSLVARMNKEYTKELIIQWIQMIYKNDVYITDNIIINRVYAKKKITHEFILSIPSLLEPVINDIMQCMQTIANTKGNDEDEDEDEEGEIEVVGKKLTIRELNEEESKLTKLLSKVLPKLEGDKIIQIGTTVHRYGSDNIIYKNIVTLNSCNNIEECDVVECKTEKELLMKWKELMNELNTDIITGYNIFGFDMEYIWNRAQECGIMDEFCIGLGRMITKRCELIEQKLSSSALGENILKYFEMDGVVMIDLLKVMQREQKLDSYKLDNVAQIFLGDKKDDLKPNEIFEKFKGTAEDRCIIAKYCIQDCCLVNRLIHKLKILENNIGMGNVCLVPLNYLFRRGQGIKIFSLIAKQCMDKNLVIPSIKSYNENKDSEDGYEGAVVLDPKEGIYLNEPIVVFDYGSLYPSSMIARNLSHDCYLIDEKYRVNDPNIEFMKVSYDLYEGIGDKKKKVGEKVCEFAQYKDGRKGIIAEILDMLLQQRKNTRKKIEYQTIELKDGTKHQGFANETDEYYELVNIDTNEKIRVDKQKVKNVSETYNRFEQDVFDALQLAYKITANSLYGQIGARTSPVYLKDIAACTTATGREMIMMAKGFVEKNYGAEVIYGDTDSIFCKFPLKDSCGNAVYGKDSLEYAIEVGKDVEKNIASIMPKPQKLNYEKSLYPFILFSKKRYVGNLYETDVNKFKQKSMGIVLKRRDNAPIVKKIYGGIIDIILNKQDINMSIEFLKEELEDLVNGRAPITDLVISKSLRGTYKDPSKIAHKVLADRIGARDPGNKPVVNDRIPFVYIKVNDPTLTLQGDRIENPDYIVENNLTPDYLHYITNQIMKPVLQLYALCLDQLPRYDKDDEYWYKVEEELKKKTIYEDDIKRKNRIDNLRLNMVKELLFDEYIYRLCEPKTRKKKTTVVVKEIKENKDVNDKPKRKTTKKCDNNSIIVEPENVVIIPNVTNAMNVTNSFEVLKLTINIKKNLKSKEIISEAFIGTEKKKQIVCEPRSCKDKHTEMIEIICAVIEKYPTNKIIIKTNFAAFVKDYTMAYGKYQEFMLNQDEQSCLLDNAANSLDTGIIKNIAEIRKYESLLKIRDKFEFKN
jgi:DNA polymerase elongation subunit (family B)